MKQKLKQLLSQRLKQPVVDAGRILAAVLVPIYYKQGQYYILLTRRTENVKEHKGQISFPGGAFQEGDGTLLNTALRECTEEIGLKVEDVEILGELDDTASFTSNYVISPFVAFIPWPYHFQVDRGEVDELIEVPILALRDKEYQETEVLDGEAVTSYSYHYRGQIIWGATARILKQFLGVFSQVAEDK
jgi:8-oxo-dGTP pyrophosphatase MutT (NUDIX family)